MTDKEKRLKQLKKINFPSDQELEEIEQLTEELNSEHQEEMTKRLQSNPKQIEETKPIIMPEEIPKPRKRSLLEIIIQKIKKKPATFEEIQQLKLERMKAFLQRDIAKANHERKNLRTGINKEGRTRKKSKTISQTPRGSADGGLRKMIGTNESRNYKDLTG